MRTRFNTSAATTVTTVLIAVMTVTIVMNFQFTAIATMSVTKLFRLAAVMQRAVLAF